MSRRYPERAATSERPSLILTIHSPACRGFSFLFSAYFGHASRSPSTLAWQSAYIRTVSVAHASTSRPVTPVSRSRPGQLESKFAGIGIAGDLGVEDAQPI